MQSSWPNTEDGSRRDGVGAPLEDRGGGVTLAEEDGAAPRRQAPARGPGLLSLPEERYPQLAGGRPLKVLQVSHDLRPGGLQRVVVDMAAGLKALGHESHVCSLRGDGPLGREIAERGIRLWAMPWPERGADRMLFLKLARILAREQFDVVHTHNTHAFLDGGLAALLAQIPARIHTDHARPFPDKRRYMWMERLMSLGYHKVVGVSAHTAENLRRYEGIDPGRLEVILNGIDGAAYREAYARHDREALRRAAGLDRFGRVIGLGVRLEEQKGIRFLLEALPAVVARHPDLGVAIAGTGSLELDLRMRAADLGLEDRVRFLGAQPRLDAFYPLLDAFVLPSLWEGLPLCLLEAMSLSLPIVATAVGGVPDLLEDGRTALLVPPADARALSGALLRLLDDSGRAAEIGREAGRVFDKRFDASVMVRNYLGLYRRALGETDEP
jgi:glycosyltransferase involved in cell wall biosynthesis